MGEKTRRPYLLSDADFDTFNYVDMKKFLAGPNSLPNRPDHLVPQQAALADAFHLKLDEYKAACGVRDNATSAFAEAVKAIREKLRWMQMALPGLTPGSDEILVPFGLDHDVPADNDEMKNYADAVDAHWQTVRTEAIYAPFQANIDALAGLFPSYVTAQSNQNDAQQAAALIQNQKEDLRKQLEDVLAALIDWYRIYYKDPQAEYWTQTPWGKSSGEEPAQLPAVTGLALDYDDPNLTVTWDEVAGADGYKLMMGNNPTILTTTLYVGPETRYIFDPPGGHHYFRVWAMKGDDLGARGDAVDIEIEGVPPAVPKQLKVTREGGYLKWEWKSGGDVPQYYRLYIATVATGSPAPSRPAEPDVDELITLSVSTFAPGPGNTVYGWVTAFGDGAESDADGPVGIDVS